MFGGRSFNSGLHSGFSGRMDNEEFCIVLTEMLERAATRLPCDVVEAIRGSLGDEECPVAIQQLESILENIEVARREDIPLCQDTGLPIFFLDIGTGLDIGFDLIEAIREVVRRATDLIPLRPNVVDPLTRENTLDNTGVNQPVIHVELSPGKSFQVDLMLKGAGSENWSELFMLNPITGLNEVKEVIINSIKRAGGQPCPPTILGIGLGGSADLSQLLAKKALLKPINQDNEDKSLAELESELIKSGNKLDIGPMGLGGNTTLLGVNILKADCHTASLPLALNFQCWAARRARARLIKNKLKIEVPKND